jgi:hypothetical protein
MEMLKKLENFIAEKTKNVNKFKLLIIDNQGELVLSRLKKKNPNLIIAL